jgi:hypothetical protein
MNFFKQQNNNNSTTIFIHIPKAAGVTVQNIINRQYQSSSIYKMDGRLFYESMENFKVLPNSVKEEIGILEGHMYFGMHNFLPQNSSYITLLRHPVDRAISSYFYILERPNHYLSQKVTSAKMNLLDFVSSGLSGELDNCQTRLISGIDTSEACSIEMYHQAKENLQNHFAVVGIVEEFDKSMILLKRVLNWKLPLYTKRNVTKSRLSYDKIDQLTLDTIAKLNKFDLQLYDLAKSIFSQMITDQGIAFRNDLFRFKILNYMYKLFKTR